MPYPEIGKHDSTYYLWEVLFECKIPYLASTSTDYIRQMGFPDSGDPMVNNELMNQWIHTALPIEKMIDYFKKNVTVRILKPNDTKVIYEYIENHLMQWKRKLEYGVNIGDAPIDDLIMMDRFANKVYEHAKWLFTEEIAYSTLIKSMSSISAITRSNFIKMKAPELGIMTNQDDSYVDPRMSQKRESLDTVFKNSLANRNRMNVNGNRR